MKIKIGWILLCCSLGCKAQEGVPFFVNYPATVYGAHNRNADVVCDTAGHVYVANFEGVLHYDFHHWEVLYAPGYSRVTRLYADTRGRIWVGGYQLVGNVGTDRQGNSVLNILRGHRNGQPEGEVDTFAESGDRLYVRTSSGKWYSVFADTLLVPVPHLPEALKSKEKEDSGRKLQILRLANSWQVQITDHQGIVVSDTEGEYLFSLSEQNGLCSNRIARLATDSRGNLWGATDNGLFRVILPAPYSRYTSAEGLKGEVVAVKNFQGTLYVGTLQGLYWLERDRFIPVQGVTQACWELCTSPRGELYAATSDGVFQLTGRGSVSKVTGQDAFTLFFPGSEECLLGAVDGIWLYNLVNHSLRKVSAVEKVTRFRRREDGMLLAYTLYGQIYACKPGETVFEYSRHGKAEPLASYTDREGYCWQTDLRGKNLQVNHARISTKALNCCLYALREQVVRVIYSDGKQAVWVGGDFGLIRMDLHLPEDFARLNPRLFLREIRLNRDSVFQGSNFSLAAVARTSVPSFASAIRSIRFSFATDAASCLEKNEYRYRLEGYEAGWSPWNTADFKEYINLSPGNYTFRLQARDGYGRESEVVSFPFVLLPPFYLKWYCVTAYGIVLAALVFLLFKWRMRKLVREKEKLELLISRRTRQLMEQKNEIGEKSRQLEETLCQLRQTQNDLLRQEKMATVGKLTQGLIDRILNPLNYINNFARLSLGLIRDLRRNFSEEQEHPEMDYRADSLDIIEMTAANLEKIEEHGGNTTRILKAMEEVLKNRSCQMEKVNLTALCYKALELLRNYYDEDFRRMQVVLDCRVGEEAVEITGNAEQLLKTLMSLLNNGMYAILKKYQKKAYVPVIGLQLECVAGKAIIRIRDNGTGIEPGIWEKIFDPFFTTKTTGEAAGIGLYLSKEIILNHLGEMNLNLEKEADTEFVITLPLAEESSVQISPGNNFQ